MIRNWSIHAGIVWSILFAVMSFYWAAGGMIGVESLGGAIYQLALVRDPSFLPIVWATGLVKVGGAIVLLLLLKIHNQNQLKKWFSLLCMAGGIFMILYGLGNMVTISMAGLGVLDFDLSAFAMKWRLLFWEPFWIAGGIFYLLAGVRKLKRTSSER